MNFKKPHTHTQAIVAEADAVVSLDSYWGERAVTTPNGPHMYLSYILFKL